MPSKHGAQYPRAVDLPVQYPDLILYQIRVFFLQPDSVWRRPICSVQQINHSMCFLWYRDRWIYENPKALPHRQRVVPACRNSAPKQRKEDAYHVRSKEYVRCGIQHFRRAPRPAVRSAGHNSGRRSRPTQQQAGKPVCQKARPAQIQSGPRRIADCADRGVVCRSLYLPQERAQNNPWNCRLLSQSPHTAPGRLSRNSFGRFRKMERRTSSKPFRKAIDNFPLHKEEIDKLPRKYDAIFARYPYKKGKYLQDEADFFMDLVLHCEEAKHLSGNMFLKQVCSAIEADLHEQMQQVRKLYNPYHNLYLDKCYGESKSPLSEWMDFSKCGE